MRALATLILALTILLPTAAHAAENQLTPEQVSAGWISLFDGETLFGWHNNKKANWQVADGAICVSKGEMDVLATTTELADYQLHVEFQAAAETNSGIFLRTALHPQDPAADCYELNIAPASHTFPTGSFVERIKIDSVNPAPDQWHAYDVTALGNTITVQLDGKQVVEFKDPKPLLRGHLGLQLNSGPIAFRNIRLKPLSSKPIFNGKDLSGWNTDKAEKSRFEVTPEGELRVLDGRGQLESDGSYGNFVLQLECFVNGDALNSGVFFRCIPGDFMMGYECQIQNGMKDDDPTQATRLRHGRFLPSAKRASHHRQATREWFALTLLADGPTHGRLGEWPPGKRLDRRPASQTKTLAAASALEPGTLAIQGHDPTTDLRFRKHADLVELPGKE